MVTSLRSLLALVVMEGYAIIKFDVKAAFLFGEIQEDIFIKIPDGMRETGRFVN